MLIMDRYHSSIVIGVFTLLLVGGVSQTINDTDRLMSDMLQGYNKHLKPTEYLSDSLQISMAAHLLSIENFNEIEERLSGVYSFVFIWEDFKMKWDLSLYNNTFYFTIKYTEVWVPDFVVLLNPSDGMSSLAAPWQRVWHVNTGTTFWHPGANLKTTCVVNVAKYPFDTQSCPVEFIAWGFAVKDINLTNYGDSIDRYYFRKNSVWDVTKTEAYTERLGDGETAKTVFMIHLKRKSGFVVVNVILPILFISVLNLLVFLLPVESGERVSYSITCLLSIAVFMTIVSDTLPKNSDPVAVIAYVLMTDLGVSGSIAMSTILIMRIYYKPVEKKVPMFMNRLINISFGCTCVPQERSKAVQDVDHNAPGRSGKYIKRIGAEHHLAEHQLTEHQLTEHQLTEHQLTEHPVCKTEPVTWRDVSAFLDVVCFVVFLSVTTVVYIVYFLIVLN